MQKNLTTSVKLLHQKYSLECERLSNSDKPTFKTIQRKIQPFCKTTLLNNMVFTVCLKGTRKRIKITKTNECYVLGVHYYEVTETASNFVLSISASNLKELFHKINNTYNLLNPVAC